MRGCTVVNLRYNFCHMSVFFKRMSPHWVAGILSLLLASTQVTSAQQAPNNDGFQRRNGQMQVVRNGQPRAMTRDARLPTGVLITKDGFVVAPDGQRIELREGQGCDLRGRPVVVRTTASGALVLGVPAAPPRTTVLRDDQAPHAFLAELFGSRENSSGQFIKFKKGKKHHGKGKGRWKEEDD